MDTMSLSVLALLLVVGFHTGESVKCHVCNSGESYDKQRCADLPDPKEFIKDCVDEGLTDHLNYSYCRKLIQDVEGDYRVVRTCATSGRIGKCVDRTGTAKIKVRYCECENSSPDEPCNSVSAVYATIPATIALLLGALFLSIHT